jgi:hypothetical protein
MNVAAVLESILEPFSRCLNADSARRVVELRIPAAVQDRIDVLARCANEGFLTPDERDEYDALIDTWDVISILKLKARRQLDSNDR